MSSCPAEMCPTGIAECGWGGAPLKFLAAISAAAELRPLFIETKAPLDGVSSMMQEKPVNRGGKKEGGGGGGGSLWGEGVGYS